MSSGTARSVALSPFPQEALDDLCHRRRLRFPEPLESQFRADYFDRWRTTNRWAFLGGGLMFALFGFVDTWAAPQARDTIWILRFGVGCSVVAFLLALSFTGLYRRLMQPAGAFVVAFIGSLIALMAIAAGPSEPGHDLYVFGIAIVMVFGYAAPRLRFWYATAAAWTAVLASLGVGFHHAVWGDGLLTVNFVVIEMLLLAANLVGMLASYFIESSARRDFIQQLMIHRERARSDALLLNILPTSVAERLKNGEEVAETFEEATVMFADLVGFTPFAETQSPHDLTLFLNSFFSRLDALADHFGLEKIKTIGDCYMAVCGVPIPRPNHAERVADMVLSLDNELRVLGEEAGRLFRLRVGINTGPVVAGVIGTRKFSYDLWGDTVNTASRMQSCAAPGEVLVTASTFERLCDAYVFEGPRTVPVKGKGELATYRLRGSSQGPLPEVVSTRGGGIASATAGRPVRDEDAPVHRKGEVDGTPRVACVPAHPRGDRVGGRIDHAKRHPDEGEPESGSCSRGWTCARA